MQVVNGVTKGGVATGHPRRLSYVANNVNKRDYKRAEGTQQSIDHLKKISNLISYFHLIWLNVGHYFQ